MIKLVTERKADKNYIVIVAVAHLNWILRISKLKIINNLLNSRYKTIVNQTEPAFHRDLQKIKMKRKIKNSIYCWLYQQESHKAPSTKRVSKESWNLSI